MITLNETIEAEKIIKNHKVGNHPMSDIALVTKYYYTQARKNHKRLKINDVIKELQGYLANEYPDYDSFEWYNRIKKVVNKVKAKPLYDFDYIPITENELKTIEKIKNKKLEKLAFTCLVIAKYYNLRNPKNNGFVNVPYSTIFKTARVTATTYQQPLLLHTLKEMGLVKRCSKVDNPNFQVLFIDDNSPVVLEVNDLRELGYTYLQYKGENFVYCARCGVLMKKTVNNNIYCKDCRGYQPIETKTMKCVDCGKEFTVNAQNMKKKRCDECQKEYRNMYQRELMKKRKI